MRYFVSVIGVLVIVGALAGTKAAQIGLLIRFANAAKKQGPPPETVSTSPARNDTWEDEITTVGSIEAAKGVLLSTEAPGTVTQIRFESGQVVKKGDVLVQLDASVEMAQRSAAIARRHLAKTSLDRSDRLTKSGALAQAQLDTDEASLQTAAADVSTLDAQIARKTIRAPFDGRLGIRTINLGQYVSPGVPLATLESIDAVYADFSLPQQRLGDLALGTQVRLTVAGGTAAKGSQVKGTIAAIDPVVDSSTRNVRLRASVEDPNKKLRPGMFVEVTVVLPAAHEVVAVPVTALVHASYGDSVYLAEPDADGAGKAARQQFVRVGLVRGDFVALTDGVRAGQEVVSIGAFKLRNGAKILVDNTTVKPDPQIAPTPENR